MHFTLITCTVTYTGFRSHVNTFFIAVEGIRMISVILNTKTTMACVKKITNSDWINTIDWLTNPLTD